MNYDQIIRNALRLAKAPRRFASGGEVVPKKMGTSPIPKGMVRRFHVTGSQNIDDIKKNGLTMQKARGIEGPKAIYSWPDEDGARSYAGPYGSIVEFYDHPKNYDSHPYARLGDVPKDQILAIHEPWHESYRYALENNVPSKELRDAGGPDYEKAADALDKSRGYALGGEADPKDISPSISNPVSVFPKPQRMFPSDAPVPGGQYLGMPDKQDMTGHKSAVASIGVHPGGKPYFNASKDAVDQTGTAGKAKTKTNLFKQKAGWSWQNAPEGHEDTNTIVSVEHRGKHYYALNAHFPKGVDFARYEKAKSEPRLRPTTTGDVFLGPQAGTISVRGKEHPVYHHVVVKADGGAVGYASGGIPASNPSINREENFKKWFGNSKAIDGEGKPWVHYHATPKSFSEFIPGGHEPNLSGQAIWLTPDKNRQPAAHNIFERTGEFKEGANVMPLYVKIENPLYYDESDQESKRELDRKFGSKSSGFPMYIHSDDLKKLKAAGYDGIFHMNSSAKFNPETGEGLETIVFSPYQVKSAIGNSGNFDPNDANITKTGGGAVGYASGGVPANTVHPDYEKNLAKFMERSVLKDENGKPLRLYHGTSKDIVFNKFKSGKRGIWLTTNPYEASEYAAQNDSMGYVYEDGKYVKTNTASRVIPVHANITNPYKITDEDMRFLNSKSNYAALQRQLFDKIASKGHDGVDMGGGVWVAFHPEQVKSAIGNVGTFDPSKKEMGYASGGDVDQPRQLDNRGFYSAAAEAARSLPQAKGSPSQMMATMKGVKPSELEWSGAGNAFADQKTVTRDDLAQHFEQNVPKITETVLGGKIDPEILRKRQEIADMYLPEFKKYLNIGDIMQENYHPDDMVRDAALQEAVRIQDKMREHMDREAPLPYQKPTRYKDWTLGNSYGNETPSQRGYREILLRLDHPDTLHQSSHWDDPNVIAHLRMQDRGPNNDVLHLEELQSDWAQKGRDEGFFTKEDLIKREAAKKSFEEYSKELADKYGLNPRLNLAMYRSIAGMHDSEVEKYEQLQREAIITGAIIKNKKINPAPYVTNTDHWTELALKRALIEAARGGYNKLVWTPGEEQAKRYRLGNYVDKIKYYPKRKHLVGYKNGEDVFSQLNVTEDNLREYIGQELADEIMKPQNSYVETRGTVYGSTYSQLTGQQLFMGGKGMKKYYGEILPNALRRVLKPHTDKIQPTSHVVKNNDGEDVTLPGIEITPEMRESILKKGFAHYAHGGEVRQHFEVGGGADGGDSGGGDSSNGDGGGFSSDSDMADFGSQTEREDSSPAAPSYSPTDQDPSMLGGATGMVFSPLGSGSLGVGIGQVSGSVFGNAEQNLNTGPGVVGFIGGSPLGALAYAMEQINNTYYDGKARADVDQNVGGPSSGQNPTAADVVYPQSANPSGGFRLSSDDDETQAGMVKPVAFAPPAPPMMASGGKARNSHPVLSIPGVHIREEIHGRPIFLGDRNG
jgi:hypothetical protein